MPVQKLLVPLHSQLSREAIAQMAESVDALVSNTSGAIHPGSIPGLGTKSCKFLTCGSFLCKITIAQMAESVDALVSNTSGATHPGSIPGLGTKSCKFFNLRLFLFYIPPSILYPPLADGRTPPPDTHTAVTDIHPPLPYRTFSSI